MITCSLITVARDEDRFLDEWIDYYKKLGINKIFIGDNNPPENPLKINDPCVEIIPYNYQNFVETGFYDSQCYLYNTVLDRIWDKYDYCLICDVDEFLEFKQVDTIQDFIQTQIINPGYTVAEVWWETYDDNDLIHSQNIPVQSLYTRPQSRYGDPGFVNMKKSIFKLCKGIKAQPHWPIPGSMKEIGFKTVHVNQNIAVCKHYRTKCLEDFIKHKAANQALKARGSFGNGNIIQAYFSINYITAEKLFWACKFMKEVGWKATDSDRDWILNQFKSNFPLITIIIDFNEMSEECFKLIRSSLNEVNNKGINFLGINYSPEKDLTINYIKYFREYNLPVLSIIDDDYDYLKLLKISKGLITTPYYIVLDKNNFSGIYRDLFEIYNFVINFPHYLEGLLKITDDI